MIKIKCDVNSKMLENFQNQTFPDICILTSNCKINLVLAYLAIDSAYFASLTPDVVEVELSHLPEQALIQVLRALYGDQLIAYSVSEMQEIYQVISQLEIDDFKGSIQSEILKSTELMENLEILEFCLQNNLLLGKLKQFHFSNHLRALEDNRNFLQLNKISLQTLISLLAEYFSLVNEQGYSTINNIMENYFNRNNIRAAEFFQENDVQPLQVVWEQFHHTLQIYDRKPTKSQSSITYPQSSPISIDKDYFLKRSSMKTIAQKQDQQQLEEKNHRILELKQEIQEKDKLIEMLRKELHEVRKSKGNAVVPARRIPSIPVLMQEDEQISILEGVKNSKKQQIQKSKYSGSKGGNLNEHAFSQIKSGYKLASQRKSRSQFFGY